MCVLHLVVYAFIVFADVKEPWFGQQFWAVCLLINLPDYLLHLLHNNWSEHHLWYYSRYLFWTKRHEGNVNCQIQYRFTFSDSCFSDSTTLILHIFFSGWRQRTCKSTVSSAVSLLISLRTSAAVSMIMSIMNIVCGPISTTSYIWPTQTIMITHHLMHMSVNWWAQFPHILRLSIISIPILLYIDCVHVCISIESAIFIL